MAWSVLQSASFGAGSNVSSVSVTMGSNCSSGTKLIAYVSIVENNGFDVGSVKDGASNAFTKIASVTAIGPPGNNNDLYGTEIWVLDTPAGDVGIKPTITATWASADSAGMSMLVQEVSGLAAGTSCLDGTAGTSTGNNAGPSGTPTYASSAANEYLVAVLGAGGYGNFLTVTSPSGYTPDSNNTSGANFAESIVAYKNSTGGTESDGYSWSGGTVEWAVILVAFQLPGAAAGAAVPQAQPGRTWRRHFRHQQQLPPPAAVAAAAAAPAGIVVFPPAITHPPRHRAILGARGALAAGILATGIGPPAVPAPHQPPAITHPAPHRAQWRTGQGAPPGVTPQKRYPVTVYARAAHRAQWRIITGAVPAALPQPFRPPVRPHPAPHRAQWRGGAGTAAASVLGTGLPPPFRPATVFFRPAHRASWRVITGTAVTSVPGAGAPQPFTPPTVFSRRPHRAQWRAAAGKPPAPAPPPFRPVTVYRRAAHGALWRAVTGRAPAAVRQPRIPATVFTRAAHRVTWRAGAGSPAPPPPPFQVARSTPSVTAPDTSAASVSDPRDGTKSVTAIATSSPGVS